MKVRIALEFDVNFETDGEQLDYHQLRFATAESIRDYFDHMIENDEDDRLVSAISDYTDFLVSDLTYNVTIE